MNLIVRWDALGGQLFGDDSRHHAFRSVGRDLLLEYRGQGRYYHTDIHLAQGLTEISYVYSFLTNPLLVELAFWFHDVVYNPLCSDNEVRSAAYAERVMREWGMAEADIATVVRMIHISTHTTAPTTSDEKSFVDADLSIFGQSPSMYHAYARDTRREWFHLSSNAFADGRISFLEGVLARDTIYQTVIARGLYEDSARRNICNEISYLGRHRDTV